MGTWADVGDGVTLPARVRGHTFTASFSAGVSIMEIAEEGQCRRQVPV